MILLQATVSMNEIKRGLQASGENKASLTQDKEEKTSEGNATDTTQEDGEKVTACLMPPELKPLNPAAPALLPQVIHDFNSWLCTKIKKNKLRDV